MKLATAFALMSILFPLLVKAQSFPYHGEKTAIFEVPKLSTKALQDNPPCGSKIDLATLMQDKKILSALATKDPKAAAVVGGAGVLLDAAVRVVGGSPGDWLQQVNNSGRTSNCDTKCIVLPKDMTPMHLTLSNRSGKLDTHYPAHEHEEVARGGWLKVGSSFDYSGWDAVGIDTSGDRAVICATVKNWSDTDPSRQAIRVIY